MGRNRGKNLYISLFEGRRLPASYEKGPLCLEHGIETIEREMGKVRLGTGLEHLECQTEEFVLHLYPTHLTVETISHTIPWLCHMDLIRSYFALLTSTLMASRWIPLFTSSLMYRTNFGKLISAPSFTMYKIQEIRLAFLFCEAYLTNEPVANIKGILKV